MNIQQRQRRAKIINVEHVPEPVARALAAMVDALQQQFPAKPTGQQRIQLPIRPGKIIGSLRREDLYAGA